MSYSYNKYKNHHKTNMICQNCGKKGHHFRNCNQAKNSFGIVAYIRKDKINKYLMILEEILRFCSIYTWKVCIIRY